MSRTGFLLILSRSGGVLIANIVLRWAMDRSQVKLFSAGLAGLPQEVLALGREPLFLPAIASYGLAMLIWLRLIATEPLSIPIPRSAP